MLSIEWAPIQGTGNIKKGQKTRRSQTTEKRAMKYSLKGVTAKALINS